MPTLFESPNSIHQLSSPGLEDTSLSFPIRTITSAKISAAVQLS
jgi:hypothetical protein